jgi:hypothetical protein
MSQFLSTPFPLSAIGLVSIPLALWGILSLTIWLSFRLRKLAPPKFGLIIAVAFLQTLLGLLSMYVVERIRYLPFLIIGAGLGVIILSDLFFITSFLKRDWKRSLPVWAIASLMQLVFLPVCSAVMLLGWFVFYFSSHPPQP